MTHLAISLGADLLPRIGQEPSHSGGFQSWLANGTYVPQAPTSNAEVVLERVRLEEFVPFVSYDFERFVLSCRETYETYTLDRELGFFGWPALKAYYASFFSAHALMRGNGFGVVNITADQFKSMNTVIQIYHKGAPMVTAGSFLFRTELVSGSRGEANVHIKLLPKGPGVHETFWIAFSDFIRSQAERAVNLGLADSNLYLAEASELSDAICKGSKNGVWMSSLRNEINYQHKHEIWFPVRKSSGSAHAFAAPPNLQSARLGIGKEKTPIVAFLNTAIYIVNIGISVGSFAAARSKKATAFGQKWRRLESIIKN